MAPFDTDARRWAAVQSKDVAADGKFVYCVTTTEIYCRPVCKARLARQSNVVFHKNSQDAEAAGFRPCKRCKPELAKFDPEADKIDAACQTIRANANEGKGTNLKDLAADAEVTEAHFHRLFKKVVGMTPKAYAMGVLGQDGNGAGSVHSSTDTSSLSTPLSAQSELRFEIMGDPRSASHVDILPKSLSPTMVRQLDVEFTIQEWFSGFVLIAAARDELCAIDVSDSQAELISVLQRRFPTANLLPSRWSRHSEQATPFGNKADQLFSAVMEAIENPTGKTLLVPPDFLQDGLTAL